MDRLAAMGSQVTDELATPPALRSRLAQIMYSVGNHDWRMDAYFRVTSFLLFLVLGENDHDRCRARCRENCLAQCRDEQYWVPQPEWVLPVPTEQGAVGKGTAELSRTVHQTSHLPPHETKAFDVLADVLHSWALHQHESPAGQGDWYPGEDPICVIRHSMGAFSWPARRNIMPWGTETVGGSGWPAGEQGPDAWSAYRYSDAAIEALVFQGIGQHRVVRIDRAAPGPLGAAAPAGARFVLSLGFAEGLEAARALRAQTRPPRRHMLPVVSPRCARASSGSAPTPFLTPTARLSRSRAGALSTRPVGLSAQAAAARRASSCWWAVATSAPASAPRGPTDGCTPSSPFEARSYLW